MAGKENITKKKFYFFFLSFKYSGVRQAKKVVEIFSRLSIATAHEIQTELEKKSKDRKKIKNGKALGADRMKRS